LAAAQRRGSEELGVDLQLQPGFSTRYQATFPNGLTENEIVQVYFGPTPDVIQPNPAEVVEIAALKLAELLPAVRAKPSDYAFWFRHYLLEHETEIATGVAHVLRSSSTAE